MRLERMERAMEARKSVADRVVMKTGRVGTDIVAATVYSAKPRANEKNAENKIEPRMFGKTILPSVVQVPAPRLEEASK